MMEMQHTGKRCSSLTKNSHCYFVSIIKKYLCVCWRCTLYVLDRLTSNCLLVGFLLMHLYIVLTLCTYLCFFFDLQDDLSFKLEYVHPYLDGVDDRSKNRTFNTSCFNTRKLSPVFVAGPNMDEAPPVWIDRVGFKANITEVCTTLCSLNLMHGSVQEIFVT